MPVSSPVSESRVQPADGSPSRLDRAWPYLLLFLALGSLIAMLVRGAHEYISYDGFWHVFIATQDRWKLLVFEYKNNAHPPIFFLLLRLVSLFGHSRPVLRSVSVGAGFGSICLIGIIARKLYSEKLVALLAALAYGFSIIMLEVALEVRSYSLCLFFVLLAFNFLIDLLKDDPGLGANRAFVLWSLFSSLAIGTEYYAIFFLVACLAAMLLRLAAPSDSRRAMLRRVASNRALFVFALLLPFATITYLYRSHMRHQPPNYGHVIDFYWLPGSSVADFLLRNLRADLNFVLPFALPSTASLLLFLASAAALFLFFRFFRVQPPQSRREDWLWLLPAFMVAVLLVELIAASLLRRYPFGGLDRQQSILFPFLFLTGFAVLDRALSLLSSMRLRAALACAGVILIGAHFNYGWRKLPVSHELFTDEFNTFQAKMPPAQAIYIDQLTLINYYIHTNQWTWRFLRHLHEPNRVDEYQLTPPSGQKLFLFRNLDAWNFSLRDPSTYQVLAHSLTDAKLITANLLVGKQVKGPADPAGIAAEEAEIRRLAAHAGLQVTSLFDNEGEAGIAFFAPGNAQ